MNKWRQFCSFGITTENNLYIFGIIYTFGSGLTKTLVYDKSVSIYDSKWIYNFSVFFFVCISSFVFQTFFFEVPLFVRRLTWLSKKAWSQLGTEIVEKTHAKLRFIFCCRSGISHRNLEFNIFQEFYLNYKWPPTPYHK